MTDAEKQAIVDAIRAAERGAKSRNSDPMNLNFDLYEIQDFLGDVSVTDAGDSLEIPDLV